MRYERKKWKILALLAVCLFIFGAIQIRADRVMGAADPTNGEKQKQTIYVSAGKKTMEYGSKISLGARSSGDGKLTYITSKLKVAAVSSSGIVRAKGYGEAVITIRASETEYYKSASKKVKIKVVPKVVQVKSVTTPALGKMQIVWKKDKTVSGYDLWISTAKNYKASKTQKMKLKKTSHKATLTNFKVLTIYYIKIRAFKKVGKKTYYGGWSEGGYIRYR